MAKHMQILLIFAVVIISASGCASNSKNKTRYGEKINDDELLAQTDDRKLELLAELEKKYENPKAHYELGKIYHSEGLWDKAEWEYNKTLAFNPVHHRAQASIVKLLIDKNDETRSQVVADLYMTQAGVSAKHSLLLGRAFQEMALDDYALACYKQAHALAPNSVAINKQIGYYYLLKKDRTNAEIYLRRAFDLDPTQAEIAGELGRLGVQVKIPRKKAKNIEELDKLAEEELKEADLQ